MRAVIGAMALAQLISWGTLYYGFSLFIVPMERDLGWSRTDITSVLSLGLLVSGLAAIPIGFHLARYNGRWLMTLGSLLASAAFLCWSFVDNITDFYFVGVALGLAMSATLYEPAFAVITARYPDNARRAITVMTLVGGFASTLFVPLTQILIEAWSWRAALWALSGLNLLFCVSIHCYFLRDPQGRDAGQTRQDATSHAKTNSDGAIREALRNPVFWCLGSCFALYNLTTASLTFHLVPLATEYGLDSATIVLGIALIGPMQVLGRVVLLMAGDRATARMSGLYVIAALPLAIGILTWLPLSVFTLIGFAILYGGAHGIMTIVRSTAVPDFIGPQGYAAINGVLTLPIMIARAIAPAFAALIWTIGGGYDLVLKMIFIIAMVVAVFFTLALILAAKNHVVADHTTAR